MTWATEEFDQAQLGDRRRNRRAAIFASELAGGQGRSIPKVCGTWAAMKGCYRMLNNENIAHSDLLSGHVAASLGRASSRRLVLAVEDGTSLSFSAASDIKGLGPISTSAGTKGVMVHTTLLIDGDTGETLGVSRQDVWARPQAAASRKEGGDQRKRRPRESEVWGKGAKELGERLAAVSPEPPRVVSVMDREGDIYECLVRLRDAGFGHVIRAVHNRKLAEEVDGERYSLDAAFKAPILGVQPIVVPRRGSRSARPANLTLRAAQVVLLPPKNIGRKGALLPLTIVIAREEDGLPESQRLCWVLLTDQPVSTLAEASAVVGAYRQRWRIEEFHMGLKTGCGCEDVELHSADAILNYLAIATTTSWRILSLRDAARERMPLPEGVVSTTALQLLYRYDKRLPPKPTVRELMHAIARLGGFLSRKSDGEPGWRTLWDGLRRLREWEMAVGLFVGGDAE